ncbi:virulence associated lipoprotein [Borreliella turdi]|uniref:virulence associated lipoprotein n=1 Tax=Borreliella turdi TaxID=57863 RepID=UPI001F2D8D27|nr:virulence associated lipoprotein [Borreliella turdi]
MEKIKEEPGDQYGMTIFGAMNWKSSKPISANTERSIRYRRKTSPKRFSRKLNILDLKKLKNWVEEFLSIKTIASKMLSHLLLDYKNDKILYKQIITIKFNLM